MDAATPAAQAFAVRAALASKNIQEWLEELSSWPWPTRGGSAGFQIPASRSTEQNTGDQPSCTDEYYIGSLLASDVEQYKVRIDEIKHDKEELDVEEIKDQILHNHIRPLSRPGSPMLGSSCSVTSSLSAFARMDDLTALITATTIQALPNLLRLDRLLDVWSTRLLVLKRIPIFLQSAEDGEVALQSGWHAIKLPSKMGGEDAAADDASAGNSTTTLSRKSFDVMKSILARKVAKAGQNLDVMLNMLETSDDTLPDEWIDLVDSLEREYGDWTVVCERTITEADLARDVTAPVDAEETRDAVDGSCNENNVSAEPANLDSLSSGPVSATEIQREIPEESTSVDGGSSRDHDVNLETNDAAGSTTPVIKVHLPAEDVKDLEDEDVESDSPQPPPETRPRRSIVDNWTAEQEHTPNLDGPFPEDVFPNGSPAKELVPSPTLMEALPIDSDRDSNGSQSDVLDSDFEFEGQSVTDSPQLELPVLPHSRRDSDVSTPSTIVNGSQIGYMEFSSDPPDQGTPELPRLRDMDLGAAITSADISPASTAHSAFRSSIRSNSTTFNDMPTVRELPDDESPPKTPSKAAVVRDEAPRDVPGPAKGIANNADDHLQQQIIEILESVPAKIHLTSEPPAINLNPPDFVMPTARRPSKPDPIPRSHSSLSTVSNMSSRAGTPSFTLAPAFNRNSRTRPQRGNNQDIKLYHLSRSNGEAPIKLFIRCVGENGERVMVRVGGGWADLGEYLKEYASHHGRRSATSTDTSKVEVKDFSRVVNSRAGSAPPSRPASVQELYSSPATTPLHVRKTRKPAAATAPGPAAEDLLGAQERQLPPNTPLSRQPIDTQSSGGSTTRSRSRSSSRLSWTEEDSSLGMAGPRAKQIEMSEESKAWVESVKAKVRIASGDTRKLSQSETVGGPVPGPASLVDGGKFGEMGKVGATKRLFRKQG